MKIWAAFLNSYWKHISKVMIALILLGNPINSFAASERCSGSGMSVWCHKFFWGYTKCNLYGSDSQMIEEFVNPERVCPGL